MAKDGNKQRFNAIARQSSNSHSGPSFNRNSVNFQRGGAGRGRGGSMSNKRGSFQSNSSNHNGFKKHREQKMIKFDRDKRIEFVTGFKKRKDERRFKAKLRAKEE